jgi:hypothetical protein
MAWTPQNHVNAGAEILRIVGQPNSALANSARLPALPGEHQDFMSYEIIIENHRVVVDSGGFAPEESEYFPRARAHNIFLVDGLDPQWQSAKGSAGVDWEFPCGSARLRMTDPGYGFLGLQHERAWFRMEDNAWLILDWLDGRGVHSVTSLIHFYPTF